jgi:hypothetical protein
MRVYLSTEIRTGRFMALRTPDLSCLQGCDPLRSAAQSINIDREESHCARRSWIVLLALTVFLWGLGYKLSLYHEHSPHTSHTPAAKLWLAPKDSVTGQVNISRPRLRLALSALPYVPARIEPHRIRDIGFYPASSPHRLFADSSVSDRSPPSY